MRKLSATCVVGLASCIFWGTYLVEPRRVDSTMVRSKQLSVSKLSKVVKKNNIGHIVNFRCDRDDSVVAEQQFAMRNGLRYTNIPFPSDHPPSAKHLQELIRTMREDNILAHCYRGVDRTGLASATRVLLKGGTLKRARQQLSIVNGHLGILGTDAMDTVLDWYESAYEKGVSFERFAYETYPSLIEEYEPSYSVSGESCSGYPINP